MRALPVLERVGPKVCATLHKNCFSAHAEDE
jgi:hypothetical protein